MVKAFSNRLLIVEAQVNGKIWLELTLLCCTDYIKLAIWIYDQAAF